MKILTRYILIELVKWFLLSLTVLTMIFVVFVVAQKAIAKGLPPAQVIELIPYVLPQAVTYTLPGTLLLAATSVYGRMSGFNEVVAIKAQGISPRKLLEPIWALAFVASLLTVYLYDVSVSWGRQNAQRVVVESVEEIAYGMLRTQRRYSSGSFSITVKRVDDHKLIRPHLIIPPRGDKPGYLVVAEEAEMWSDKEQGILKIVARNGSVTGDDGVTVLFLDGEIPIEFPLRDASQSVEHTDAPSRLPLRMIPDEIVQEEETIRRREKNLAVRAACQMICGDIGALTDDQWESDARALELSRERLYRLETEPPRRWSTGFSCLCFAWIGAPMAIRLRNREFLTSFFLCFLPILVVFYPLHIVAVNVAKDGRLTPWAIWGGNILLLIWGTYLLRKVIRY
ncbi:MAG: LptF/LptG family permease [Pirellulales bacterium]|nr:LptF/LptG family permease [Pirellulales bacterium]